MSLNLFTPHLLIILIPRIVPQIYLSTLAIISLYGFHKILMIWRFYQSKTVLMKPLKRFRDSELPSVTVQLPIFNEIYVVERLLDAVAQLRYPAEKLEIQLLDDSTDETQAICRRKVDELQAKNLNVRYLHRQDRRGFKAGALEYGLQTATGELALIFDADFVPEPDTLIQMVDYFTDPTVGMVQARWVHLNRNYSMLTEVEAMMLDAHFVIEQVARNSTGCFFNFNGTAGIWRIRAIDNAGGWQHSTITEDLDLSYRVQLKGWKCCYLPHVAVPAELPMEMNSFKSQQFRWAKGASQVAKKLLIPVLQAKIPFYVKFEAFLHLTNNFNYFLLMILLFLSLPYQMYIDQNQLNYGLLVFLPIFLGTTFNIIGFYWVSQREQRFLPMGPQSISPLKFGFSILGLMGIGIGLSLSQSLAVCEGLMRFGTDFVRTPKHGLVPHNESWKTKKYRGDKTFWVLSLEFLMLCYLSITVLFALHFGHYLSLPFLILFALGYGYVFGLGVFQRK